MAALLERRFKPDDSDRITCRVCFARVDLSIERIDDTPMYVYFRCPACEQWFTIRRADAERLHDREREDVGDAAC
jgi:hypothetical protein